MTPSLYDARFYSFSEFSQKATSWISPLIIASITTAIGDTWFKEITLLVVGIEILIGSLLLFLTDVPRGTARAQSAAAGQICCGCCGTQEDSENI